MVYFSSYLIHKLAGETKIVILMGVGIMPSRKQKQSSIPLKYHKNIYIYIGTGICKLITITKLSSENMILIKP